MPLTLEHIRTLMPYIDLGIRHAAANDGIKLFADGRGGRLQEALDALQNHAGDLEAGDASPGH